MCIRQVSDEALRQALEAQAARYMEELDRALLKLELEAAQEGSFEQKMGVLVSGVLCRAAPLSQECISGGHHKGQSTVLAARGKFGAMHHWNMVYSRGRHWVTGTIQKVPI